MSEAGAGTGGERIDRLARDGLLALVGAGVSAVLNLVLVLVVIHAAGRYTAGVVFAATSLFLIAETASRVGCPTGLMYFLVRARTLGHPDRMRSVLRVGLIPVLVVSVLMAVLLFALGSPLAHWIAPAKADAAVGPLHLLALLIPAAALSDSLLFASRALGTMRPLVLVERMGRPVLQVVCTVTVLAVGWKTAASLSLAWGIPYLVTAVVAIVWAARLVRTIERRAGVRPSHGPGQWAEFWRFTTPRALQSIVQIALQRLPIVLIAALIGPAQAAVYAAVTRFLVFGQLGSQAITAAVQPQLGALLVRDDHDGAQHIYQVSTCWLVLLCWPVYLGLAVFSFQLPLVFGHGYQDGTAVLIILAGAMLFATGSGMVDSVLAMAGKTTWTLANASLALVVDVILNLLLIPHIGILGAAIAWACALVANNALPLTQLAVSMHLHPFGRGTLTAMAVAAAWLGVLPVLAGLVLGGTLAVLVPAMAVGLVGYALTVHRLRAVVELDALVKATRRRQGQPTPVPA